MATILDTTSLREDQSLKETPDHSSLRGMIAGDPELEKTSLAVGQEAVKQTITEDDEHIEYPSGLKLFLLAFVASFLKEFHVIESFTGSLFAYQYSLSHSTVPSLRQLFPRLPISSRVSTTSGGTVVVSA